MNIQKYYTVILKIRELDHSTYLVLSYKREVHLLYPGLHTRGVVKATSANLLQIKSVQSVLVTPVCRQWSFLISHSGPLFLLELTFLKFCSVCGFSDWAASWKGIGMDSRVWLLQRKTTRPSYKLKFAARSVRMNIATLINYQRNGVVSSKRMEKLNE